VLSLPGFYVADFFAAESEVRLDGGKNSFEALLQYALRQRGVDSASVKMPKVCADEMKGLICETDEGFFSEVDEGFMYQLKSGDLGIQDKVQDHKHLFWPIDGF